MERTLGYVAVMCLASETRDGTMRIDPDPANAHWTVQYRWKDDRGRFCTNFICEAYATPGADDAGQVAERIASALSRTDTKEG